MEDFTLEITIQEEYKHFKNRKIMKKLSLLIFSSMLLVACGSGDSSETSTPSQNKTSNNTKVSDCLAKFNYDYDKMLTKEDILKHVSNVDAATIKSKLDKKEKVNAPEYGECEYSWPSDRPKFEIKISTVSIKKDDDNKIIVSRLKNNEDSKVENVSSAFDRAYKTLTEEEIEEMNKRIEKSMADKSEKEKKMAKGFVKQRGKFKYEFVNNVGDKAYWKSSQNILAPGGVELVVLAGKAQFTIDVKVSTDQAENLDIAKKMANEVIAKCN